MNIINALRKHGVIGQLRNINGFVFEDMDDVRDAFQTLPTLLTTKGK